MSSSGTPADPVAVFLPGLEASGVPYMVTGGIGAIVYGQVRVTNDIDLVLALRPAAAAQLARQFDPTVYYVPPIETMQAEARRPRDGHFNLLHLSTALRADCYLAGEDPLLAWGLARRERRALGRLEGWIAPPEYVIVLKLRYFREGGSTRHLRDIAWMLRVSADRIAAPVLEQKVAELGLGAEWAAARATGLDG